MSLSYFSPRSTIASESDDGSVARLFGSVGPFAISRRVAKIVVDSINCQVVCVPASHRPFMEVCKFEPLIADRDPFAAIDIVCLISASREHVFPANVKPRPGHPVSGYASAKSGSRRSAAARQAFAKS